MINQLSNYSQMPLTTSGYADWSRNWAVLVCGMKRRMKKDLILSSTKSHYSANFVFPSEKIRQNIAHICANPSIKGCRDKLFLNCFAKARFAVFEVRQPVVSRILWPGYCVVPVNLSEKKTTFLFLWSDQKLPHSLPPCVKLVYRSSVILV